jgi:capsid protein
MIMNLPPGRDVRMASPPTLTSDALPMRTLRKFAANVGITYEDLTGDYSNVNFSSARMARLAHWAHVNAWQQDIVIPQLCIGVWNWAMQAAVIAGELPVAPASKWTPPPMPMLEPDKEGLALQRLVRTGAKTFSEMVREQGHDPDEHWAEYAADMARLDALKIKLDSDVRAVAQTGQEQPSETAVNSPPEPKSAPPAKREDEGVAKVIAALDAWVAGQKTKNGS